MIIGTGLQTTPMNLRLYYRGQVDQRFKVWTGTAPFQIVRDLRRSPEIDRLIVWGRIDRSTTAADDNPLKRQLNDNPGGTRRHADKTLYPARDHWVWQDLFPCRRREYAGTLALL